MLNTANTHIHAHRARDKPTGCGIPPPLHPFSYALHTFRITIRTNAVPVLLQQAMKNFLVLVSHVSVMMMMMMVLLCYCWLLLPGCPRLRGGAAVFAVVAKLKTIIHTRTNTHTLGTLYTRSVHLLRQCPRTTRIQLVASSFLTTRTGGLFFHFLIPFF